MFCFSVRKAFSLPFDGYHDSHASEEENRKRFIDASSTFDKGYNSGGVPSLCMIGSVVHLIRVSNRGCYIAYWRKN